MGTQAHWFKSQYRYRIDGGNWLHADTLADIWQDVGVPSEHYPVEIEIERWEGRKRDGSYKLFLPKVVPEGFYLHADLQEDLW